jgi:hypothetical protein
LSKENVILTGGSFKRTASDHTYLYNGTLRMVARMNSPRLAHNATLLNDGNILVTGGFDGQSFPKKSEIYLPKETRWFSGPELNFARTHHSSTLLKNGKVLIAGGFGANSTLLDTAEVYDPDTNRFVVVGKMIAGRGRHRASLLSSGEVLITGGENLNESLKSAELFDPISNTFSNVGNLNSARTSHTSDYLDSGRVVLSGGYSNISSQNSYLNSVEIYDQNTKVFSMVGTFEGARHSHRSLKLDEENVLICGGVDGSTKPSTFHRSCIRLNLSSNTFVKVFDMLSERAYFSLNSFNSKKLLICGGNSSETLLNSCEVVDENYKIYLLPENL